ncbi:MAG: hypothetical protein L0271_28195 [Gemmatimonadetes bacterium]|nr:hypothetical protein [Gemmatimonadota bacterium]
MLDGDPLVVPPRKIPEIRVLSTWLDGHVVFNRY